MTLIVNLVEQLQAVGRRSELFNISLWCIFGFGVLKATTFILRTLSLIFDLFLLPSVNYSKYGAGKGKYCVITGASDGIGKEFAFQMARRHFNLVLISRTLSKLETIQKELQGKFGVEVKILSVDISRDVPENYTAIREVCEGLPITVLINNVGQSHSIPVPFLATEEKELRDIITINNTATLLISQLITPIIVSTAASSKCRGLILTMGSFAGLIPTPLLATYSGSKSFLQGWSNALAGELRDKNVDVELALSYLVTSSMSKIRRASLMIPNAKNFVSSTLKNVGRRCGAQERFSTITPYWSHALYHFIIEETVGVYSKLVNSINYTMHKSIRVRALRKAEREAKKD
ncbi:hypothetical protein HG535_0C01220 [Zygotorulaspora mrakii]|uniref:Very-long-chain 3-oxoacyl-CoA reductase n=1 Tax=Zygotorulaspora mrakii TaxID=42260 RepID=A0A7H9AZW5_ZYGMR|nr:uncharacterized protein HG535_0C01220 [Zygotorulaspora mrakii]QLG71773.1 hypothetical protein HG535_0C01220 [Zygotorulaspora mrakii]